MRAIILLAIVLVVTSACLPRDPDCSVDSECATGRECTRNGECVLAGTLISVRITWTVHGQPPDEALCAPVGEFAVKFVDTDTRENLVYRPVPCTLGLINFDRMPPRFDKVELIAYSARDRVLDRASSPLSSPADEVDFDLTP
ncbi:MAG: hypothetical protein MJE77_38725 [Proteobacteria bacterium]|nr:hypothetical protein [Pseudomonadota bacterium]